MTKLDMLKIVIIRKNDWETTAPSSSENSECEEKSDSTYKPYQGLYLIVLVVHAGEAKAWLGL